MSLIVEDGAGIAGAESYASVAAISAYWAGRSTRGEAAAWAAADQAAQEAAAREATQYLDAVYGSYYRGMRAGYEQGLLWPRTGALDLAGRALPALPAELVTAVCELAGRAVSATLAADADNANGVKRIRQKVDVIEEETEYATFSKAEPKYGFVAGLLASILNGSQPDAPGGGAGWAWA